MFQTDIQTDRYNYYIMIILYYLKNIYFVPTV